MTVGARHLLREPDRHEPGYERGHESHPKPVPLDVFAIESENDFDRLEAQWKAVYAKSTARAPALDFQWMRSWWRIYGSSFSDAQLEILIARLRGQTVAILPLFSVREVAGLGLDLRCLRFLSTGEPVIEETCPEYLDAICLPGFETRCAALFCTALRQSLDFDRLSLTGLRFESALLAGIASPQVSSVIEQGTCWYADLSDGFEAYLAQLSTNSRQQIRRLLREADKADATLTIVSHDEADTAFDTLVRLHQERWQAVNRTGAFISARFRRFHRNMLSRWLPGGQALLATVSTPHCGVFAVLYGFALDGVFHFYQSGLQHEVPGLRSPGRLAHLLLMDVLAKAGFHTYDFLAGDSRYKRSLSANSRQIVNITLWNRTPRAVALRLAGHAAGVTRRLGVRLGA